MTIYLRIVNLTLHKFLSAFAQVIMFLVFDVRFLSISKKSILFVYRCMQPVRGRMARCWLSINEIRNKGA